MDYLEQQLSHHLAVYINEKNLINLAKGLLAGREILEQNDALELLKSDYISRGIIEKKNII